VVRQPADRPLAAHLIALYPTARKVEDWLKRHSREGALLGYPAMTFPQLIDRLWREFGSRGAAVSDLHERLAAQEAIGGHSELLGDTAHVLGLIRQFKSAGLDADDLRAAARSLAPQAGRAPGRIDARVDAVADALARYQRILEARGLCDRHDCERIVLDCLLALERQGRRPALLEGVRQIRIAEIYDFSLLQFMIVSALIRMVGDAVLTIQAADHPTGAARFPELTWNRFVAEESIADKVLPGFVRREGRSGRLGFVLEHLFAETAAPAPPADDTLAIVEAPTPLGEVEEVARAIRRALESPAPIAPERIAIVARDLEPYAAHLRSVFRRYRIPLALAEGRALRASAPARLVAELVRVPTTRFSRESLAALCRSAHLHALRPGMARILAEVGYLDAHARPLEQCFARHLDGLRLSLEKKELTGEDANGIKAQIARIERSRKDLVVALDALQPLGEPGTLRDHLERLRIALEILRFDPAAGVSEAADRAGDISSDAARAWGPVRGALEDLARWASLSESDRRLEPFEFARMVETALDSAVDRAGESGAAAVTAMPVLEARGLDFDLVFVIGLNDGLFPRYQTDDPLLPDDVKVALDSGLAGALARRFGTGAPTRAGVILRTRYERNSEDFFLFFLALSMPSRCAVLSYAAAEANGARLVRSPFIDEVARVLGNPQDAPATKGVAAARCVPLADDCFSSDEFLARAALEGALSESGAEAVAPRPVLDSIGERASVERERERWLALPAREETPDFNASRMRYAANPEKFAGAGIHDGRVAADARLARLLCGEAANPRPWSATQINELAACGFKFLAARVLRLGRDDEDDYELNALEGGELIHEILHGIVERIDFSDSKRARAEAAKVLTEIHDARLPLARDPGFFEAGWRSIAATVEEFIDLEFAHRAENPSLEIHAEHEIEFTLAGAPEPAHPPLHIKGRIDRLELHPRGRAIAEICVIDYKNSRNADKYGKAADPDGAGFGWTDFQLPVYLMGALREFHARLGPDVALRAGYVVLRSRDKRRKQAIFPVARDLVDPAASHGAPPIPERILALCDDALAGRFDVDPRRCDDWCPYRAVCRYYKGAEP